MGDLIVSLLEKYSKKTPVMRVPGFVSNKRFSELEKIHPKLGDNKLLFVGHGPDYYCKGLDILIDSFKVVKKNVKDAELYIAGRWNVKKEWEIGGVYFLGNVDDGIEKLMGRCSLGVHMGRGESFGLNVPEMMLAGLPVITSNFTGSKEVVEKFDNSFILDLDKELISNKIISYLKLPPEKKRKLSRDVKRVAREYSEDVIVSQFRKNARSFLEKL